MVKSKKQTACGEKYINIALICSNFIETRNYSVKSNEIITKGYIIEKFPVIYYFRH